MQRAALSLLAALLLVTPGCGTLLSIMEAESRDRFPPAFGGVRLHAEAIDEVGDLYFGLFPITFPDLILSLAFDLSLLPVTGPPSAAELMRRRQPVAVPTLLKPAPPRPPSREELRLQAEERARQAKAEAAEQAHRAKLRAEERSFEEALAKARRLAPEDGALHARLAHARVSAILHSEDGLYALPALSRAECEARLAADPCDGVAWAARGAGWLEEGDLDRAVADLGLGVALCRIRSNAELARAELRRADAARAVANAR